MQTARLYFFEVKFLWAAFVMKVEFKRNVYNALFKMKRIWRTQVG